jgi:hypothetical protein
MISPMTNPQIKRARRPVLAAAKNDEHEMLEYNLSVEREFFCLNRP